ncbi:MAG: AraC family transcriptional regulator [Gemmatimonadota bacterium]
MRAVYREFPPSSDLRGLVETFWTIRSDGRLRDARINRVVPDGCTDIIVALGDPAPPGGGGSALGRASYFVGAMRRPRVVRLTGAVDLIGVRMRPGAGGAILPMPAAELTDRTEPLDDVVPGRPGAPLLEALADARDTAGRIARFETLLRRRAAATEPTPKAVLAAIAMIGRSGGRVTVRELQERVGLSARQLQRLFARFVGVSPKTACRVARFRAARRRLDRDRRTSLGAIAYGGGYADQAHFNREFKEFAGIAPGAYRAERADVASVQDGTSDDD